MKKLILILLLFSSCINTNISDTLVIYAKISCDCPMKFKYHIARYSINGYIETFNYLTNENLEIGDTLHLRKN